MVGNERSNSNMLRYLPHYLFLILILISRPASALWGVNYKLVIESRQSDDVIKFKCQDLGGFWVTLSIRVGRPGIIYYQLREKVVRYKVICIYAYKNNLMSNILLFDGYNPDEECRYELGGCIFIIKDSVMYKKTRRGGTRVLGDLPDTICKYWWFNIPYDCREKPHLHPYVGTIG